MARTSGRLSSAVELELFGGPRVLGPEGAVALSPFQLALLTIVFAEQGVTRPRIASILWRERDAPKIRHRIRQLLHQTNARLGLRGIETTGDGLQPGDSLGSDIGSFREAFAAGRLAEVATMLARGFAPLTLPGVGGEYEDWVESTGAGMRRRLGECAAATWEEATAASRWDEARDAAECLHVLRPEDGRVVAKVIEARARAGRIGSAEAAYAALAETLGPGREPDGVARDAIERARALRTTVAGRDADALGPFVGREDAMARGRVALDRVGDGAFSFFLVTGESGIGKTRLLQELERDAVLRDFRCIHASPVELERRIPLNPILDALKVIDLLPHLEAIGTPWSTVIGSTLPAGSYDEMVGELPPIQESSLPRRLLDAFAMLLEQIALEKPTVFFLDDLHWADTTTVAALQFFQRRWTQGSFGIFASVRRELIGRGDPAEKYLAGGDDLEVSRVELGELTKAESVALIDGIGEGTIEEQPIERLCALAGFHPLYLTELTRDYLAGRLKLPELPADEVTIPLSLKQILRSRIDVLSEQAIRIASLLAVSARAMRLRDIAALTAVGLDDCAGYVEELEVGRLVEARRDLVRISHELFRSALYTRLSEARRAVLHRALAEHLLTSSADTSPGELAIHFDRAGEAALATEYGWTAASGAWENGAMAEAAYFYELVTENESDEGRRAEGTAGLAMALYLNRDIVRANPILELAARRLRESGETQRARRIEVQQIDGLAEARGSSLGQLLSRLHEIREEGMGVRDWASVALALDVELRLLRLSGDTSAARELYSPLRAVTERAGSNVAKATAFGALAIGVFFDNPEEATQFAHSAVRLTEGGSADERLRALNRLLIVLYRRGRLELPENQILVRRAKVLAEQSGDLQQRLALDNNLAIHAMDSGDLESAQVIFERVAKALGSSDATFLRANLSLNRAELALIGGDYEAAGSYYCLASQLIDHGAPVYVRDIVNAGLGLCALEMGSLAEARRCEERMAPLPTSLYYDPTLQLSFRSRVLERRGERKRAVQLLEESFSELQGRLVLASLKVRELQLQIMLRGGSADAADIARDALAKSQSLKLPHRARAFRRLLDRAASRASHQGRQWPVTDER